MINNVQQKVLIVGSGGREHAIGVKILEDNPGVQLYFAPGNGGTSGIGENLTTGVEDIKGICTWAKTITPVMTIIGPEAPLSKGVVDQLQSLGFGVFGPTQRAAEIESSKSYAKDFMVRHGIPTAQHCTFNEYEKAVDYIKNASYPVVVKASGLAAGKGVVVPESTPQALEAVRRIMKEREFGSAGDDVVIEERLSGEEVSLMAFTDGVTIVPMLPAQDHKRLLDGDSGPNTGGMGAYCPVPICTPQMVEEITRSILEPTIRGLAAEGRPFVGVLYAGLMLTEDGPKVLEFNCRLGDPETQAVLPLLETNVLDIVEACVQQKLHAVDIRWSTGVSVCVVLASRGYPVKPEVGFAISGLPPRQRTSQIRVFHAGTTILGDKLVTSGGRVLALTGLGNTIPAARKKVYKVVERIMFEGATYRTDIGARGEPRQ